MQTLPVNGAILQRDKETFAIVPKIPCGLLKKEHLLAISAVVEKYDVPLVKITSGQRIALIGLKEEQLDNIYNDLEMKPGQATELCLHYVQACPGTDACKFGVRNSLQFGIQIEDVLSKKDLPAKLKIGISGCPFSCAENLVRDIGIMGKKKGWTVSFGGNSGRHARIGNILAEDISDSEVLELIDKCLNNYVANARKRERTSRFIERTGVKQFKTAVL
jgi:NAD(P)H-nitrite reductase large subunit